MSDLALIWSNDALAADVAITAGDLEQDEGLRTAVFGSLFTNAPARPGDVLPDGRTATREEGGWWADGVPVVPGDRWGCRLWLLSRAKETPDVLALAEGYASEGLQWLVDDKVALRAAVVVSFLSKLEEGHPLARYRGLLLDAQIVKPSGDVVSFRFARVWDAEARN